MPHKSANVGKFKSQAAVQIAILIAGLSLLLGGLVLIRNVTQGDVGTQERYNLPFTDIECDPPPGATETHAFLTEVQYLSDLPSRLPLLEEGLAGRLAVALARHPWVEKVEHVAILPNRRVHAQLAYRMPVLAVVVKDTTSEKEPLGKVELPDLASGSGKRLVSARAVDGHGVLLPASAPLSSLPVLLADVTSPRGPAGSPWSDRTVEAAARTAACLKPHQEHLRLEIFEIHEGSFVLKTLAGSKVLWGHGPDLEQAGETLAREKIDRLLRYCEAHASLDELNGGEFDVRFRDTP